MKRIPWLVLAFTLGCGGGGGGAAQSRVEGRAVKCNSGKFVEPVREDLLSFTALDQFRRNDTSGTILGRQFNTGTATTDATGSFFFNFGNVDYSGAITEDGCFGFGMTGAANEAPTTMSIGIMLGF